MASNHEVRKRAHRAAQQAERAAAGSLWQDHGLVFVQQNGAMIDPSRDWEEWKRILREAGVRDGRLPKVITDATQRVATVLFAPTAHNCTQPQAARTPSSCVAAGRRG